MEPKLQFDNRSEIQAKGEREWFIAVALLIAYSALNLLIPTIAAKLYLFFAAERTEQALAGFTIILATLTPLLAFSLLGYVYKKTLQEAPVRLRQFQFKDLLTGLLMTFVIIVSNAVISLVGEYFSYTGNSANQETINELTVSFPVFMFITAVFIAPVVEEFFYRKLIMGHIFKNFAKTGLVISSLLFALAHFSLDSLAVNFNPFHVLSYFVMGLCFGLIYYKTKRIEAAISAHFINNLISTVIIMLLT